MKPVLSIISPALKEAAGIETALQALQPLRARCVELVMSDGGSGDTTVAVAPTWVDILARTVHE